MFQIVGKQKFEQWDIDQLVTCDCLKEGDDVVFRSYGKTYETTAFVQDGKVVADVPNFVLQKAGNFRADLGWGLDCHLDCRTTFDVEAREKPEDYECPYNIKQRNSNASGGVSSWNDLTDKPFYSENGMVDILPETEIQVESDEILLFCEVPVTVGNDYTVSWNGVEYNCTAVPFEMEGMSFVALGDVGVLAGEPTGSEPFAMLIVPPEMMVAFGGAGAMIVALDGSSTVTLSIKGEGTVVHKLDNKYLDEQYLDGINSTVVVRMMVDSIRLSNDTDYDVDGAAIKKAIKDGKSVVLRVVDRDNSDNFHDFQLSGCENGHKGFYRIDEFGIDWLFVYDNTATFRRKLFSELVSE